MAPATHSNARIVNFMFFILSFRFRAARYQKRKPGNHCENHITGLGASTPVVGEMLSLVV